PIAGVRVGRVAEEFVCNPSSEVLGKSDLNLFLVGRKIMPGTGGRDFDVNLVMLEGGAHEVVEDVVVDAIKFGLESLRPIIALQDQMRADIGREKRIFEQASIDDKFAAKVSDLALSGLKEAYNTPRKQERQAMLAATKELVKKALASEDGALEAAAVKVLDKLECQVLREMILREKRRVDGRAYADIRPISSEVGILPRVHGSALFTRGETQALAVLTLGTSSDEQRMDLIGGEEMRSFMLHYNFPPYSVGEAKFLRGPGRREIGHGALARRALLPILPSKEEFPYTIRIVSEILSSNGSSSMATVCGGSLSLMDAGVPVSGIVAGIAMGLLKEGDDVAV
ncbi:MAG: polyribonucleotide nucleotidyltransferase, partial [Syntrophales bacterium]|nr:polyribonucleotide nucleotidyltransferase [Syntrophales bacterium]